jgi:hypothetical protein
MTRTALPLHPAGRTLFVSLALVANLIAVGAPVLHAWAHGSEDSHHHAAFAAVEVEQPHDEVHPLALHDEGLLAKRVLVDFALALPVARSELVTFVVDGAPGFHAVVAALSRAPPARRQARAPPSV